MHNLQLCTPFMVWKGLFYHLEKSFIDDYHEFKHAHEIQIEEWWLYQSPRYAIIIKGIVAPSGAMATPNINLASGSASDSGTIISG